MRALALAVLLLAPLAGCSSSSEGPTFMLSGSFTAQFGSADRADFAATVKPYSDDVAYLESFPEQFMVHGIVGGCEQLRATLQGKDYVASVGACAVESAMHGGDEATSSP